MGIGLRVRHAACVLVGGVLLTSLGACGGVLESTRETNVVAGKQQFVSKCGGCHTLNRAGTKGTTGPNLDEAFANALASGMKRSTVEGAVRRQIAHPADVGKKSPVYMPPNLVKGDAARDVAAYVASVTGRKGQDTGLLATAVKKAGSGPPAQERNGKLEIDADPTGQLAYVTNKANAQPGKVQVSMKNKSTLQHDIAIQGNGVNAKGPVVGTGGTSSFTADLKPGTYTYFCTVPGHREGGMHGTLTVK